MLRKHLRILIIKKEGIFDMKKILFMGDSITDCGRSRDGNIYLGNGYATVVACELSNEYPGKFEFINRGISGNRIIDLYARIKSDCLNLQPDYMSILVGVNDVWHDIAHNNGIDNEKFYKIFEMYIEEIKKALPNIEIIILEPFCLAGNATEANYEQFRTEVLLRAETAKKIAKKYNLKFIKLQDKLDELSDKIGSAEVLHDGVHPNIAGNALIAMELVKVYKTIID